MKKILCFYFVSCFAVNVYSETITIVGDNWCPVNCDPKTKESGFLIDLAKEILNKAGHQVDYRVVPWTQAIKEVREGKYDALVGAGKPDAPDFIFPENYQYLSEVCLYTNKNSVWKYIGIESLNKIMLRVIKSYYYTEKINEYIEKNPTKVDIVSGTDPKPTMLRLILADNNSALIEFNMVWDYFTQKNNLGDKTKQVGCDSEKGDLYIAFSPKIAKAKDYAKLISDGTTALIKSGVYKDIKNKYGIKN